MTAMDEALGEARVLGALAEENEGPEETRHAAIVDRMAHRQHRLDQEAGQGTQHLAGQQSSPRLVDLYWHLFAPPGAGGAWLAARHASRQVAGV